MPIKGENFKLTTYTVRDTPEETNRALELEASNNALSKRVPVAQERLKLTVQDWQILGMLPSRRELEAIPGELRALRITRLNPDRPLPYNALGRVDKEELTNQLRAQDPTVSHVQPLYRYDRYSRLIRDTSGRAVVDRVRVYHDDGMVVDPEIALSFDPDEFVVPLPWRPGGAMHGFQRDHEWFREVAAGAKIPAVTGFAGTAGRLVARFNWLQPTGTSMHDFAGAVLGFLLPHQHSLYEALGAMRAVGVSIVDDSLLAAGDTDVEALYRAVAEQYGGITADSPWRSPRLWSGRSPWTSGDV